MEDAKWSIKVTSKGQITLPKKARDALMIREGDHLDAVIKEQSLIISKRSDITDSEQIRLYADKKLTELGYSDAASLEKVEPICLRERMPSIPVDLTQRIREERERS